MYCHLHRGQQGSSNETLPSSILQNPCQGITAKGTRCKKLCKKESPDRYCHLHRDQHLFRPPSLQLPPSPDLDLTEHLMCAIRGLQSAIEKYGSPQLQSISGDYLKGMKITEIANMLFPEAKVPPSVDSEITEPENHSAPMFTEITERVYLFDGDI
jgi:hypothetical protein